MSDLPNPSGGAASPPTYRKYRARPGLLRRGGGGLDEVGPGRDGAPERRRGPITVRRVLLWLVLVLVAWLLVSLVVFLVSAQVHKADLAPDAQAALAGGGTPPFSATDVLVLGSDQRAKSSKEPGASTSGPSRSDSIMLMRVGGGANRRLSIPRDTVVDIPGHGRSKINAAYALGGPGLATRTVEAYLGVKVDHVVLVSFTNFPALINAMGGIDYTGDCVRAKVNGGDARGGVTLDLPAGTSHHLDGKQALALARVRKNACRPKENDIDRARRQQQIVSAMKGRLLSPTAFLRLPFISWAAPKALDTDMGGPSLLGLFTTLATHGSPPTRVLQPSGYVTLPDGGSGVTVSGGERQREVQRFLHG